MNIPFQRSNEDKSGESMVWEVRNWKMIMQPRLPDTALFQPLWECAYTKGRLLGTCGDLTTFSAAWAPMLQRTCCSHYLNLSTIAASMPTTPSIVLHDSPNAPRPGRRNTGLTVTLMFSRPKMFHSQSQLCIIKYDPFLDLSWLDHHHKTNKKDPTLIKSTPLAACSLAPWADWPSGWSMWYSWTRLVASSILRMKEFNITKGFSTASQSCSVCQLRTKLHFRLHSGKRKGSSVIPKVFEGARGMAQWVRYLLHKTKSTKLSFDLGGR